MRLITELASTPNLESFTSILKQGGIRQGHLRRLHYMSSARFRSGRSAIPLLWNTKGAQDGHKILAAVVRTLGTPKHAIK